MKNPFTPAGKVDKKLKLLIYGASGSGKTTLALGLGKLVQGKTALIDLEGGADLYADAFPFDVLRTKDYQQVKAALDYLESGQSEYGAVIVDPISVLWAVIIEAAQAAKGNMERSLTFQDWGVIKRKMNAVYTRLVNLPVHVIVIARAKDEYEGEGDNRRRTGTTPDAEKSLAYLFDVVVSLESTRKGRKVIIEKDRSNTLGSAIDNPTPDSFLPILARVTGGERARQQTDEEAAQPLATEFVSEQQQPAKANGTPRPYSPEVLQARFNEKRGDAGGARLSSPETFLSTFVGIAEPEEAERFIKALTGKKLIDLTEQEGKVIKAMLKDTAAAKKEIADFLAAQPETEPEKEEKAS